MIKTVVKRRDQNILLTYCFQRTWCETQQSTNEKHYSDQILATQCSHVYSPFPALAGMIGHNNN